MNQGEHPTPAHTHRLMIRLIYAYHDQLTQREQAIIHAIVIDEKSRRDTAKLVGVSSSTVQHIYHNALARIYDAGRGDPRFTALYDYLDARRSNA